MVEERCGVEGYSGRRAGQGSAVELESVAGKIESGYYTLGLFSSFDVSRAGRR